MERFFLEWVLHYKKNTFFTAWSPFLIDDIGSCCRRSEVDFANRVADSLIGLDGGQQFWGGSYLFGIDALRL